MVQRNDEYLNYRLLVDKVAEIDGNEPYIIGNLSPNGGFQEDAKQIAKERPEFEIIHAKLYLCARMQETEAGKAIEWIDEVNEDNIEEYAQQTLRRLV